MSHADSYRYQIEKQRQQEIARQRVQETTRPFLERFRRLLDDVVREGLDVVVPIEYRDLNSRLIEMESSLDSDPFSVREDSRALADRFHALPRLAQQQRRAQREAERVAAEAFRQAQQAETERRLRLREELEFAWREGLSGWSTPVALNAAFSELQALRGRLLGDQTTTVQDVVSALRDVQQRYEADAARQLQVVAANARREAVLDVLSLQREQLVQEANRGDNARASRLHAALAQATGLAPEAQADALDKLAQAQEEAAIDESQRREVVRAVYQSLQQAGFVVDAPMVSEDTDEVLIRARRPAGPQADFRVNVSGHLSYKFHQYRGSTCEKDIVPVMASLQDAYGIRLSEKRVIWVNPPDIDQDARPYPDATRSNSR